MGNKKARLYRLSEQSAQGFSLVEVLVSITIFGIGLLGIARLLMLGLTLTSDSLLRTTATIQANDIIDRMRANVTATALGTNSPYNNPNMAATAHSECLGLTGSGKNNPSAQCTSTQMAEEDFYEWYANLKGASATNWQPATPAQLPSGAGVICIDSTPHDGTPQNPACDNIVATPGKPIFAVKIWWVERKDQNAPGTLHQYVTSFAL